MYIHPTIPSSQSSMHSIDPLAGIWSFCILDLYVEGKGKEKNVEGAVAVCVMLLCCGYNCKKMNV